MPPYERAKRSASAARRRLIILSLLIFWSSGVSIPFRLTRTLSFKPPSTYSKLKRNWANDRGGGQLCAGRGLGTFSQTSDPRVDSDGVDRTGVERVDTFGP